MTNEQLATLLKSYVSRLETAIEQAEESLPEGGKVEYQLGPFVAKETPALQPIRNLKRQLSEDIEQLQKAEKG